MILRNLADAIKRRVSSKIRTMIQSGYLNSELQRTRDGIHTILNFLEEKYEKEFVDWLNKKVKEAEKEEKN